MAEPQSQFGITTIGVVLHDGTRESVTRTFVGVGESIRGLVARHPLGAISLCYCVIWLIFSNWHSVPFASIETDGMEYIRTAQTLFTKSFSYSSFHGIGYPIVTWIVHLILPDWFQAAKLASGLAGLVFVGASFLLIEALFDRRAALIGATLVLTNIFVLTYSGIVMADMLGAALGLLALLILVRADGTARYVWAGLLVGLAAITRYQYFGLVLAGAFLWLLEATSRSRIRATVLYWGVFALGAGPLLFLNWKNLGNPLANSNFANFGPWFYSAPESSNVHSWQDLLGVIVANPLQFAPAYLKALVVDLPSFLFHVVYYSLFFTVPGWALALQSRVNLNKQLVSVAFLASYVLVTGLGWLTEGRFWLFTIPFIAAGCAFLVVRLSENGSRIGLAALTVLIAANVVGAANRLPVLLAEQAPEFERAGQIIRGSAAPDAVVLVSQPQVGYFAERPAIILRDVSGTWTDLPQVIEQHRIQYVVMDDRYGVGHYPELENLFDVNLVKKAFPGWQMIYGEMQRPRIVVYRILTQ